MNGNQTLDEWKKDKQDQIWTPETVPEIEATWANKPKQILKHHAAVFYLKGDSVLDVGCGTGDLVAALKNVSYNGAYLGVDPSNAMLDRARQQHPKHHFINANLYDLENIASADTVICLDVLHHQKHIEPGFTNILKKAKKRLIVTLWINDRDTHHEQQTIGKYGEYITYYTEEELRERFKDLNYVVIKELGCPWKDMYIFDVN